MSAPTLQFGDTRLGLDEEQPSPGADQPSDGEAPAGASLFDRLTKGLNRYEVVIATVAAIVLITRLSGGAFTIDRLDPQQQASGVTPFASPSDTATTPSDAPTESAPAPSGPFVTAFPAPAAAPAVPATSPRTPAASPAPAPAAPAASEQFGDSFTFATLPAPGAPTAISVSPSGEVWVGTDNGPERGEDGPPKVFQLSSDGTVQREYQPTSLAGGITDLVVGESGAVHLLARAPAGVFVLDPDSGATEAYASIPDVAPCIPPVVVDDCDAAIVDQAPSPSAMAFDADGSLFVADAGQGAIWRIPAGGGDAEQWLVEMGWASPAGDTGPTGLAFDGAGNLVVAVQGLLTEDVGVIYLIEVTDDDGAGEAVELARTEAGERPAGIALGASGRVYVPLSAAGQILVLDREGEEVGRTPTEAGIDTPMGIAFRGTDLLVTAQAPTDATAGQVVRLPVEEPGGTIHAP